MRTSKEIRNLKTREDKCWKVIDQLIASMDRKQVPSVVRLAAAEFVLSRLYPQKIEGKLFESHNHFTLIMPNGHTGKHILPETVPSRISDE